MITIRDYTLMTELSTDNPDLPVNTARVEFDVDTVDEVPTDGVLKGYTLYQGSIVFVIGIGKFYVLDSEGEWHSSDDGSLLPTT